MSYDIFVQDIPAGAKSVSEIPDDFAPQPIGPRSEIVAAIRRAAPEVDFTQPDWGRIDTDAYSIEINLSLDDPVLSFAFHVRGDERAMFQVADILAELGARALAPDTESGLFDVDQGTDAFLRWRAYRDRVCGGQPRRL